MLAPLGGSSFPSGHVLTYVGTYGFLAYPRLHDRAPAGGSLAVVRWGCLGWSPLVGPSRIYQGHHWPTDVAASYLIGLCLPDRADGAVSSRPGPDTLGPDPGRDQRVSVVIWNSNAGGKVRGPGTAGLGGVAARAPRSPAGWMPGSSRPTLKTPRSRPSREAIARWRNDGDRGRRGRDGRPRRRTSCWARPTSRWGSCRWAAS